MTSKSLCSITAAIVVTILSCNAPASAGTCIGARAEHLKAQGATYFNFYYFSNVDDSGRCANLQTAIAYQQELVAWLEVCEPGGTRAARRDLGLYTSIPASETGCGF